MNALALVEAAEGFNLDPLMLTFITKIRSVVSAWTCAAMGSCLGVGRQLFQSYCLC